MVDSVSSNRSAYESFADLHNFLSQLAEAISVPERTEDGESSRKSGKIKIDPSAWRGDPLSAWRGTVNGEQPPPNVLSNPARKDGLAIFRGADPDGSFEKDGTVTPHRNLVYTEGNNWPDGKGGAVAGTNILRIENRAGGGVLFAGSSSPGYEQPGSALTPVKDGTKNQYVPTPAHGWLKDVGLNQYSQPQVWVSVKNVDPATVEGWHQSDARPDDDPQNEDHGTPAFAYGTIVIDNGPNKNPVFSMSSSEGYDPALTGDPGYGMMLVRKNGNKDHVVAALTFDEIGKKSSTALAYADNKKSGMHAYVNDQGGVTIGGELETEGSSSEASDYRLVLAPRSEVVDFIKSRENAGNGEVVSAEHKSVAGI